MQHWRFAFLFVPAVCGVLIGSHWYVCARLIRAWDGLGNGAVLTLRILAVVLALAFPLAHLLVHLDGGRIGAAFDWGTSVWVGIFLYVFLITLLLHGAWALAGAAGLPARLPPLGPHAGRVAVVTVALVAVALGTIGVRQATRPPRVTAIQAPVKNLPAALDGFVVVQVSDIHFGPFLDSGRLDEIVARVNALRPDLILLTGDLVDREGTPYDHFSEELSRLRASHGVLAIAGNHDAMAGLDGVLAAARAAGIQVLRHEKALVAGAIAVYGVDDHTVSRLAGLPIVPLDRIISPEARVEPTILLHHRPTEVADAARLGVDLMLSGHTHRGQIWPLTYVSRLFYPCQYGSYRFGDMLLFVSRGIGTWGPPMRVGSPPEIVRITLRPRPAGARRP